MIIFSVVEIGLELHDVQSNADAASATEERHWSAGVVSCFPFKHTKCAFFCLELHLYSLCKETVTKNHYILNITNRMLL